MVCRRGDCSHSHKRWLADSLMKFNLWQQRSFHIAPHRPRGQAELAYVSGPSNRRRTTRGWELGAAWGLPITPGLLCRVGPEVASHLHCSNAK